MSVQARLPRSTWMLGRRQHRVVDQPRPIDPQPIDGQHEPALEEHDVGGEDQIIAIIAHEMVEHRAGRGGTRTRDAARHAGCRARSACRSPGRAGARESRAADRTWDSRRWSIDRRGRRPPRSAARGLSDPRPAHDRTPRSPCRSRSRGRPAPWRVWISLRPIEAVARLEQHRRLLRDHQRVERGEEIEIVAVDADLGHRQHRFEMPRGEAGDRAVQRQFDDRQRDLLLAADPAHLPGQPRVAGRDHDLGGGATASPARSRSAASAPPDGSGRG